MLRGEVRVAGERASPTQCVETGDEVTWSREPWIEPVVPRGTAWLYRDADVLAVAKPPGLPSQPGGGYLENTLLALVRERDPGAVPLHRLGRWTSGVVLFALSSRARTRLSRAFRAGTVYKRYRTLVSGDPQRTTWSIDTPIGPVPHAVLGTVHAASPQGRPSRSVVSVLERFGDRALVDVVIATGRPHQIRIHLAAAGHPLVGDPLYAPGVYPLTPVTRYRVIPVTCCTRPR